MKRRLLNLLAALSLLLCVAVVLLWVREVDEFAFTTGGRLWRVACGGGRLQVDSVSGRPGRWPLTWAAHDVTDRRDLGLPVLAHQGFNAPWSKWRRLTFTDESGKPVTASKARSWRRGELSSESRRMSLTWISVPFWMPALVSGALPLGWRRWLRIVGMVVVVYIGFWLSVRWQR